MTSFEERVNQLIAEKVGKYLDDLETDLYTVENKINDLYFNVANKMYDYFIQKYYSYKTISYIRHWEPRPGTKKGSNLYYAKAFKKHRGKDPYFELLINPSEMADDYQHDTANTVIENVMNGIRGVDPYWTIPWSGEFKSRWFTYEGIPTDAFNDFLDNYPEMIEEPFMRRWRKIRKFRQY